MESSRKKNSAVQGASVQQARDALFFCTDSKAAPSRLHSFIVRAGFGIAYAAIFIACPIAWRGSYRGLCRCYELVLLLRVLSNDEARRQGSQ